MTGKSTGEATMRPGGAFDLFDDYDFRHCIARHLEGSSDAIQTAHRILGHLEPDGRHAWFAAREARHEIAGYSEDLQLLWEHTTGILKSRHRRLSQELALLGRYALLIAGLSEVARSIPPEVCAALARAGVWTRQEAIDRATLRHDASDALKVIRDTLSAEGTFGRPDLVELALETAGAIGDPDDRALGIVALLNDLPPESQRLAANLLLQIDNEGSRLGGLRNLLERWSADPTSNSEVAAEFGMLAESFTQSAARAEAMAVLAAHSAGADREARFAEALNAARIADRQSESSGRIVGPSALESVVRQGPQELLRCVIDELEAGRIQMAPSSVRGVRDAYIERLATINPDLVLRLGNEGVNLSDNIRKALAVSLARHGRYDEALDIAQGIGYGLILSETLVALAPEVPSDRFGRILDSAVPLGWWWGGPVLRALASNQTRLQDGLDERAIVAVAGHASSEDARLQILAELAVVLSAPTLQNLIASLASADAPALAAELWAPLADKLSLEDVLRSLTLVNTAGPVDGKRAYKALLSRLVDLGEPEKALRWLDELGVLEFERGEIAAAFVEKLPAILIAPLARTLRPYPIDAERALARCALAPHLPPDQVVGVLADIAALRDPLDQVRCLSALLQDLPLEQRSNRTETVTLLLGAMYRALPSGSLYRNELLYGATKVLIARGAPGSIDQGQLRRGLKAAEELPPSGLGLAWLIALARVAPHELAVTAVDQALELVAANPGLAVDLSRDLDPDWRRQVLDQLLAKPLAQLAYLLHEFVEWLTPTDIECLLTRVNDSSDQGARLAVLSHLAKVLMPEQRSAAAAKEIARAQNWRADPVLHAFAADTLMDLDPSIARTVLEAIAEEPVQGPTVLACLIRHGPRQIIDRAVALLLAHPADKEALTLRRALFIHAVDTEDRKLAEAALSPAASVDLDDIVPGLVERLPGHWLRLVLTDRERTLQSPRTRRVIALRAAELGEIQLALELLEEVSGMHPEWSQFAPAVLAAAPRSSTEILLTYVRGLGTGERFIALAALISKVSRPQQPQLVLEAFANAHGWTGASAEVRVDVLRRLQPILTTLPQSIITQVWSTLLSGSKDRERSEVLTDIRGMATVLCTRFGHGVAPLLDDAIALGARPRWP
jgi:hypothetical protein